MSLRHIFFVNFTTCMKEALGIFREFECSPISDLANKQRFPKSLRVHMSYHPVHAVSPGTNHPRLYG